MSLFPEVENVGPRTDKTVKTCRMPGIEYKKEGIKKKHCNERMLIPLPAYKVFLPGQFVHGMKPDLELLQFVMGLINPQ